MRFLGLFLALWATIAFAQTQPNYINVPTGGFDVQAGQPFTITWQNPSDGDVTIRLTQGNVVENSDGIELGTFSASAQTATFTVPANVNNGQYNFAIQSVSDANTINFSSGFIIAGAANVQTSTPSVTSTALSTMTSGSTSATDASTTTDSSSSSASASSESSRSSSSASRTSTSSASAATTSAPSSNNAGMVKVGGMLAVMAGAVAVF